VIVVKKNIPINANIKSDEKPDSVESQGEDEKGHIISWLRGHE
jgi:hypothetical protein